VLQIIVIHGEDLNAETGGNKGFTYMFFLSHPLWVFCICSYTR